MALATAKAKLRQLEAGRELQPCSQLPSATLISGDEGSALDPRQADWEGRAPQAHTTMVGAEWVFGIPVLQSLLL